MPSAIGNFFVKAIVQSPLHPLLGPSFAVISVTGRKTGKTYSTPINVAYDGAVYTVVSLRQRTWWRNLRQGRPAILCVTGSQTEVTGQVIEEGSAVVEALAGYFHRYPYYAKYFGIELAQDAAPTPDDLRQVAEQRVVIRLKPSRISGRNT